MIGNDLIGPDESYIKVTNPSRNERERKKSSNSVADRNNINMWAKKKSMIIKAHTIYSRTPAIDKTKTVSVTVCLVYKDIDVKETPSLVIILGHMVLDLLR